MEVFRERLSSLLYWDERPTFSRVIESSGLHINQINSDDLINMPLVIMALSSDSFIWFVTTYKMDLNVLDIHKRSAVFYHNWSKNAEWLISQCCVNIHLRDVNDESPVMFAARYCNTKLVCALLNRGASLKDAYAGFKKIKHPAGFEYDSLKGTLRYYEVCQEECKLSVISMLVLKKRRVFHHDMLDLIAKMIWSTRTKGEWQEKYSNKKVGVGGSPH
jgi:hypothetical protein